MYSLVSFLFISLSLFAHLPHPPIGVIFQVLSRSFLFLWQLLPVPPILYRSFPSHQSVCLHIPLPSLDFPPFPLPLCLQSLKPSPHTHIPSAFHATTLF